MTAPSCASCAPAISEAPARAVAPGAGPASRRWREAAAPLLLFAATPVLGFGLFVALFQAGPILGMDILFYRGLVLLGVAFAATACLGVAAARRWSAGAIGPRDALSAAVLSLSVNLSFFVLSPVTIDRSVTVFILGEMAAHPERAYTPAVMGDVFRDVFVGEYRQIERRLAEQEASGNVARRGDAYAITPQGRSFIRLSGWIATAFAADRRLVEGRADAPR